LRQPIGGHSSVLGMIGLKAIAVFYHHDIWWYKIQVVHGLIAVFLCLLYTNQRTNIQTTSNTSSWGWLTTNPLSVRWPWKDRWLADSPWLKRGCWWSRVALNPNMRLAVVIYHCPESVLSLASCLTQWRLRRLG
jgi:hypothetical protein